MEYLHSYRAEAAKRFSTEDEGMRPRQARDGWRALLEQAEDCWVRTGHHQSIILFSWAWREGENSFRGYFEPTGEGSGQQATLKATWRKGRKFHVPPSAPFHA